MADRYWSGWALNEPAALLLLLKRSGVRLRHPVVVCDHVTLAYPDTTIPDPADIEVVAVASDHQIQALVVKVNGSWGRPDGEVFHITLSRTAEAEDWWSKETVRHALTREVGPWRVATTPILREVARG